MSVDFFWRRLSGETVAARSASELGEMVPHWFDSEFVALRSSGLVMGVECNSVLMDFVLTANGDADRVCQLPVYGGELRTDGEEHPEYGFVGTELWVLDPHGVQEAARFLRDVDVAKRVQDLDMLLAGQVAALGFATPWNANRAASLCDDLAGLKAFFAAAADAGDAMVKFESA